MTEKMINLMGNSPEFLRMLHAVRMVSGTDATVLITGESGVGKRAVAKEIHINSGRRGNRLVTIECAGLTDERFDSLLTVEPSDEYPDCVSRADKGTFFLDEVGELSVESQSRLLNFMEAGTRAGGGTPDVRLLASSSQDLHGLMDSGRFREDLFYHLYIVPVEVPPLRERSGDLMLLLKQFNQDLARTHNRPAPRYSVSARNLLKSYHWPGNLRELHNLCERMVILMAGKIIQPENLPMEIRRGTEQQSPGSRFLLPAEGIDLLAFEGDMIRQALGMAGGNRSKAARLLGISRDTLLYRIQKHAIEV